MIFWSPGWFPLSVDYELLHNSDFFLKHTAFQLNWCQGPVQKRQFECCLGCFCSPLWQGCPSLISHCSVNNNNDNNNCNSTAGLHDFQGPPSRGRLHVWAFLQNLIPFQLYATGSEHFFWHLLQSTPLQTKCAIQGCLCCSASFDVNRALHADYKRWQHQVSHMTAAHGLQIISFFMHRSKEWCFLKETKIGQHRRWSYVANCSLRDAHFGVKDECLTTRKPKSNCWCIYLWFH